VSADKLPIIATPLQHGIHVAHGYVRLSLMRDEAQPGGIVLVSHIPNVLNFPPEHGPLLGQLREIEDRITIAFAALLARTRAHERAHGPLLAEPEGDADAA
jgi:hypothetical protein